MKLKVDPHMIEIVILMFSCLAIASTITSFLKKRVKEGKWSLIIKNLNMHIKSWWFMCVIFILMLISKRICSSLLFLLLSFMALREYMTISITKRTDHRTLFWAFFVIPPLHYYYLYTSWYGMFSIFIPVYAFIFLPARNVITGDCDRFLERNSEIQWGLMLCVYCVSYAPALLTLKIPGYEGQSTKLLFFIACVSQTSDVLQYVFDTLIGKHQIARKVSPNKTIEGFLGGVICATLVGTLMSGITPFSMLQSAGFSFLITLSGFFGNLTFAAIKRDRGIKDSGSIIQGHGGILDRIGSLCFSAPLFFHLVRHFFIQ